MLRGLASQHLLWRGSHSIPCSSLFGAGIRGSIRGVWVSKQGHRLEVPEMALCKLSVTSRPQDWFRVDNRTLTLRPVQLPKLGVFSPRASNWSSGSHLEMPFPTPPPLLLLLSNYKKAACCNHHPDNNRRCTGTMRRSAARAK